MLVGVLGGRDRRGRTKVVVALDKLKDDAHNHDDSGQSAEAHGHGEANLFARVEEEVAQDEPGKEGEEDVDDAAIDCGC